MNYLIYGYGIWTSYHRVVRSLHNPCLFLGSVKIIVKPPINGMDRPVPVDSKKREGRKNDLFPQNPKNIGNKKMLCEINSRTSRGLSLVTKFKWNSISSVKVVI